MAEQLEARGAAPDRQTGAMPIVRRYVLLSAGAGLITLPGVDVTVLAAVHVALIKAVTEHYGFAFSEHAARNIVIAIGASLIPGTFGSILGRRALGVLPFVSPIPGLATMAACSALVSYGLGTAFVRHYEAGGTLQNFDVAHLHAVLKHR